MSGLSVDRLALFYLAALVKSMLLPRHDVVVCFTTPPFIAVVGRMLRFIVGLASAAATVCDGVSSGLLLTRLVFGVEPSDPYTWLDAFGAPPPEHVVTDGESALVTSKTRSRFEAHTIKLVVRVPGQHGIL